MKNIGAKIATSLLTLSLIGCATTSRAELDKSIKELQKSIASLEKTIERDESSYEESKQSSSSTLVSIEKSLEIGRDYIPAGTEVVDYRGDHFVIYRALRNIELNNPNTWEFEYKTPTMWRWLPAISSQENELAIILGYKEAGLVVRE
jgi:hypothetical protein